MTNPFKTKKREVTKKVISSHLTNGKVHRGWGVLLGSFLALNFLIGCAEESNTDSEPLRVVRYTVAQYADAQQARTFAGVAKASSEQNLSFRVSGSLTLLSAEIGDQLNQGSLLAQLDKSDMELRQQQAEASLSQSEAQTRNAKAVYERTVSLYESGIASMSDLDAARAGLDSAQAIQATQETALRIAKQQLTYTSLFAPVTGTVVQVMAEVNETVAAGQPIVVFNASSDDMEVQVTIPETFISSLHTGDTATVEFGALSGEKFEGVLTEVGSSATSSAGYPVRLSLAEDSEIQNRILPGMVADVTIAIGDPSNSIEILLPPAAVDSDHIGHFVYVLNVTNNPSIAMTERREVEIGNLTPEGLRITKGLESGELVATAGLRSIVAGQQVQLLDSN